MSEYLWFVNWCDEMEEQHYRHPRYIRCLLCYYITPNRAVQHKAVALYTRTQESEKNRKEIEYGFTHYVRLIPYKSIVPLGTIILHNDTLRNTKKDTILYNDTLRNVKKDASLVSIDRNGEKSKEEETWICELERMSSHCWYRHISESQVLCHTDWSKTYGTFIKRINNFRQKIFPDEKSARLGVIHRSLPA